jgi:hypothetical protein
MRTLGNLFIILSVIISILFGLECFSEVFILLVAFVLHLAGQNFKNNFNYRHFKISSRSKPFLNSIVRISIHTLIYLTLFIFIGYLMLIFSRTEFYISYLQSITQHIIDLTNQMLTFWINIPSRLMKYGQ